MVTLWLCFSPYQMKSILSKKQTILNYPKVFLGLRIIIASDFISLIFWRIWLQIIGDGAVI